MSRSPLLPSLSEVFSEHAILRAVCRRRAKLAESRHDKEFFKRIVAQSGSDLLPELYEMFPSRRHWVRPRREARRGKSAKEINEEALFVTARIAWASQEAWVLKLRAKVVDIRRRVLDGTFEFQTPIVVPVVKDKVKQEYRPIAQLELDSAIVDSLLGKYLRQAFEPIFLPCAVAFRSGTRGKRPTHHDAIRTLRSYKEQIGDVPAFVAECDIEAFYDSVSHETLRDAFRELEQKRVERFGSTLDVRVHRLIESYFESYSFTGTVLQFAQHELSLRRPGAKFKSPLASLKTYYQDPSQERLGIPQGSAISCVFSNVLLDAADRAVEAENDKDGLFLRYCDDMVLLHTSKARCEAMFDRYLEKVSLLRLPLHPPRAFESYRREFWLGKSKSPYEWSAVPGAFPWLSFVGYQIHAKGYVRIRPSSLKKELAKQEDLITKTVSSLSRAHLNPTSAQRIKRYNRSIQFRLQQRMIAMSVGRRTLHSDRFRLESFCWASGFEILSEVRGKPSQQLRALDRGRERHLLRLRRFLRKVGDAPTASQRNTGGSVLPYFGAPFSYFGQYIRRPPPPSALARLVSWVRSTRKRLRRLIRGALFKFGSDS